MPNRSKPFGVLSGVAPLPVASLIFGLSFLKVFVRVGAALDPVYMRLLGFRRVAFNGKGVVIKCLRAVREFLQIYGVANMSIL